MSNKAELIAKGQIHVNTSMTLPEIFDAVRKLETQDEKVAMLKRCETKAMRYIVNGLYNVDWSDVKIPEFEFNNRPSSICDATLNTSIKRLETVYRYRNTNQRVSQLNLTRVLEGVSKREAELIIDMLKGRKVEGVSKAVFKRAFPQFFLVEE